MIQKITRIILLLTFSLPLAPTVIAADYSHSLDIGKLNFSWTIEKNNLAAKISAPTTGWVAVGFNPTRKMKDANIIIGSVKNGKVEILDEFGFGATQHKSDDNIGGAVNVTIVGGREENGVTTLEFIIPINSGDDKDTAIDPAADTVVIVAHGGDSDSYRGKHVFRDTVKINLASGEKK